MTIDHNEARAIAQRFIDCAFGNPRPHPRFSIPADRDRDDDLRLVAYIDACEREIRALRERAERAERERDDLRSHLAEALAIADEGMRRLSIFEDSEESKEIERLCRSLHEANRIADALRDERDAAIQRARVPEDVRRAIRTALQSAWSHEHEYDSHRPAYIDTVRAWLVSLDDDGKEPSR